MSVKIARLPSRALVTVQGPDWRAFLQGLVTQDVATLTPDALRYGALLTPQGRLQFDFLMWGREDGCSLETDAGAAPALAARLSVYRLRAKVAVGVAEADIFVAWDDVPQTDGWRIDPRAPALGHRSLEPQSPNAEPRAYDAHRRALGVPDIAADAVESDYPIELNFDLMNAFDFHKGCFIGQETTSRMHRRGGVKNRLAPIAVEGRPPPFGADVLAGERRVGSVRGSADGLALALVRLDRIDAGPLTVEGRPATLQPPSWSAFALAAPTQTAASSP